MVVRGFIVTPVGIKYQKEHFAIRYTQVGFPEEDRDSLSTFCWADLLAVIHRWVYEDVQTH